MKKKLRGVATWVEQLGGTITTTNDKQKIKKGNSCEWFEPRRR